MKRRLFFVVLLGAAVQMGQAAWIDELQHPNTRGAAFLNADYGLAERPVWAMGDAMEVAFVQRATVEDSLAVVLVRDLQQTIYRRGGEYPPPAVAAFLFEQEEVLGVTWAQGNVLFPGRGWVFRGDGKYLYSFPMRFGDRIGDFNGDGVPEYFIAQPSSIVSWRLAAQVVGIYRFGMQRLKPLLEVWMDSERPWLQARMRQAESGDWVMEVGPLLKEGLLPLATYRWNAAAESFTGPEGGWDLGYALPPPPPPLDESLIFQSPWSNPTRWKNAFYCRGELPPEEETKPPKEEKEPVDWAARVMAGLPAGDAVLEMLRESQPWLYQQSTVFALNALDGAMPPDRGRIAVQRHGSQQAYALQVEPEHSFAVMAFSPRGFLSGAWKRDFILFQDVPYERAKAVLAMLWWSFRVEVYDVRKNFGIGYGSHSSGDGRQTLVLLDETGRVMEQFVGVFWMNRENRWRADYRTEIGVNVVAGPVLHDWIGEIVEAEWKIRGTDGKSEEEAKEIERGQIRRVLSLYGMGARPEMEFVALEAVRMAGDLHMVELMEDLKMLQKIQGLPREPKTEWNSRSWWQSGYAKGFPDKEQMAYMTYLARRKMEAANHPEALQDWVEKEEAGHLWALDVLSNQYVEVYLNIMESRSQHHPEDSVRKEAQKILRKLAPERLAD